MNFQTVCLIYLFIILVYEVLKIMAVKKYRKNPLPKEVSDIYDDERYRKFLAYKNETAGLHIISIAVNTVMDLILLFSGFYLLMERTAGPGVWMISVLTFIKVTCLSAFLSLPMDYYAAFAIDEKYGLNKRTKKEFWKDEFLNLLMELAVMLGCCVFLVFVGTNISAWTNDFMISYQRSFFICILISGAFLTMVFLISLFSLFMMRRQYSFHDLESGALRDRIEVMIKDTGRKVKRITVYSESKKSVRKNAFVLKLLWYREISIADNFLDGNSEEELLAVIAHECGHLRHRKNFFNFLGYAMIGIIFLFLVWLLPNAVLLKWVPEWTRASFHLVYDNYYLIMLAITAGAAAVMLPISLFRNWLSRTEEYEADRNAVSYGYGEAMIRMFKRLSADELADANPSPAIEFLEYDHPGMYRRIHALNMEIEKQKSEKSAAPAGGQ